MKTTIPKQLFDCFEPYSDSILVPKQGVIVHYNGQEVNCIDVVDLDEDTLWIGTCESEELYEVSIPLSMDHFKIFKQVYPVKP